MKLWIIGKKGILSSALQRRCMELGIEFVATTRKEVDIRHDASVKAQFETLGFSHVVNCSGYTAVDLAEEEEKNAFELNADAVSTLAKYANHFDKRLIHFSTDYVFDGKSEEYEEDQSTSPLSIYGQSKEKGEKYLLERCPSACLIRTSWLFGKEGSHFVSTMIRLMQEKDVIRVVNDQWGRPTFADDLANAALSLLDSSGVYHFANAGKTTWHGFALAIKKAMEEKNIPMKCKEIKPISTDEFGAKAKRPQFSILNSKHFTPPNWEEGLDEVICHAFELKK